LGIIGDIMLKVIKNSGFHITFENGWTASVQFGPGTYSEHYETSRDVVARDSRVWTSKTAEISAWDKNHQFYAFESSPYHEDVKGDVTPDEVAIFLNTIRNL
jgi:hypothetical protein